MAPTTVFGVSGRLSAGEVGGFNFLALHQRERTLVNRPQLGVTLVTGAHVRPQLDGVLVLEVVRNSGADSAGLRGSRRTRRGVVLGDVITAIDGEPVQSASDVRALLERRQPGDSVTVSLLRGDEEAEAEVRLSSSR